MREVIMALMMKRDAGLKVRGHSTTSLKKRIWQRIGPSVRRPVRELLEGGGEGGIFFLRACIDRNT